MEEGNKFMNTLNTTGLVCPYCRFMNRVNPWITARHIFFTLLAAEEAKPAERMCRGCGKTFLWKASAIYRYETMERENQLNEPKR